MTITSHAATDEYRDGWERIFGKPRLIPASEYRGDASNIGHIEYFSFGDGWDEPLTSEYPAALVVHAAGLQRVREHYEPIGDEL